jgi:aminoglycoside phosphotransferase (APT) family kinase protein/SAM-dependent methyltransferase
MAGQSLDKVHRELLSTLLRWPHHDATKLVQNGKKLLLYTTRTENIANAELGGWTKYFSTLGNAKLFSDSASYRFEGPRAWFFAFKNFVVLKYIRERLFSTARPLYILDVGCSRGFFRKILEANFPEYGDRLRYIGLDLRVHELERAVFDESDPESGAAGDSIYALYVHYDAAQGLPFRDGVMDFIINFEMTKYLEKPYVRHLFAEMYRVLRDPGMLFYSSQCVFSSGGEAAFFSKTLSNNIKSTWTTSELLDEFCNVGFLVSNVLGWEHSLLKIQRSLRSDDDISFFRRLQSIYPPEFVTAIFAPFYPETTHSKHIILLKYEKLRTAVGVLADLFNHHGSFAELSVSPLDAYGKTFKVSFSDNKSAILRLYGNTYVVYVDSNNTVILRPSKASALKKMVCSIQQVIRSYGLPCPKPLTVDGLPSGVVVEEYVQGIPLSHISYGLPVEYKENVVRAIAGFMAKLHSIPLESFSSDMLEETRRSFRELCTHAVCFTSRLHKLGVLDDMLYGRIIAFVRKVEKHSPASLPQCLNHGDLRTENVLFNDTRCNKLVGVLDWDSVLVCMPEYDVAIAEHGFLPLGREFAQKLPEAYVKAGGRLAPNYEKRRGLYLLYKHLLYLTIVAKQLTKSKAKDNCEYLASILDECEW